MVGAKMPIPEGGVQVRRATVDDCLILARIHKIAYSRQHFTALLPDEVLARYYSYFLDGDSEICLALSNQCSFSQETHGYGEVLGFAVFGERIPEKIAQFKRECFKDILCASLRHPWSASRKTLMALFSRLANRPGYSPAEFLLLSIAVALPRCGIGSHLLKIMLERAQQRGHKTVGLYVNVGNLSAINAYFAAGFVIMHYQDGQFYMEKTFDYA